MSAMDLYVRMPLSSAESSSSAQHSLTVISTFFNERLSECDERKFHKMPSVANASSFEFLVRVKRVGLPHFKRCFKRWLQQFNIGSAAELIIKECGNDMARLLDSSSCMRIDFTAANAPAVIATSESLSPVNTTSAPPVITTSECMPRSHDAGMCNKDLFVFGKALSFETYGGVKDPAGRAFYSTRIVFSLSLLDGDSTQNLTDFKSDLTSDIQAKTYQAVIDVSVKSSSQLQVTVACEWKNPMYVQAIRRTIKNSIKGRFKDTGFRVTQMDRSSISTAVHTGSRWLLHELPKGTAYTVPIENFINVLGQEIQAQESLFLNCQTLAQFRDDARAKQVLLCNVHDVLRWRYRQVLQNDDHAQSAVMFRDPRQSLEVPQVAVQACMSGHAPVAPTQEKPPGPDVVILTESSVSSSVQVTGVLSPPAPSSNARSRSLNFSDESGVQTPCGGAPQAGMFHTMSM
jgi:hypothetical protein